MSMIKEEIVELIACRISHKTNAKKFMQNKMNENCLMVKC